MPGERRFIKATSLRLEHRAAGEGGTAPPLIVGHAAVFDEWTTLYEGRYWVWREVIRPGAFANALREKQDVRSLFNHDANFVLGRTNSGTLALREDSVGLWSETDPPGTQTIRDLVISPIDRKDVDGMSFAFTVRRSPTITRVESADGTEVIDAGGERITLRWEGEKLVEEREVLDANLFDVSPCTYPQYVGTDVGMRSLLGIEARIAEMDRPHQRPAPRRESYRQWLDRAAVAAAGAKGQ